MPLSGIGFTAPLSGGLLVATPNALTGGCDGTISAPQCGSTITLSGAQLAGGASCAFSVTVTASVVGTYFTGIGPISSTDAGVGEGGGAGTAVMVPGNRIFWSTDSPGVAISVADLDRAGGAATFRGPGAPHVATGIGLDPAANRLYWADHHANTISYANLNGSGGSTDLDTTGATVNSPQGMAIDPAAGRIYWPTRARSRRSRLRASTEAEDTT